MKKLPFTVEVRNGIAHLHYEGTTFFGSGEARTIPYMFTVGNPELNPSPLGKAILDLVNMYRELEAAMDEELRPPPAPAIAEEQASPKRRLQARDMKENK